MAELDENSRNICSVGSNLESDLRNIHKNTIDAIDCTRQKIQSWLLGC